MFDRAVNFVLKYLTCALLTVAITAFGEMILPNVFTESLTKVAVIHLILTLITVFGACAVSTIYDLMKG